MGATWPHRPEGTGVAAGIQSASGEGAREHAGAGFDMVTVATDAAFLSVATRPEVAVARGERAQGGSARGYS